MSLATAPINYRPVLERALGVLPECTADARQSVYRRARAILDTSMQDADPPIEGERIEEERARLEQVIAEVEAQFVSSIEPSTPGVPGAAKRRLPNDGAAGKGGAVITARPALGAEGAGRRVDRKRAAARRSFEGADPTLPAILEFQRPSAAIVNVPMPLSARSVIYLVSSLVVAMIVLAGVISVDQVVTARGIVVSRSPTLLVQPLETAIVRSIDVIEGEQVHKGQCESLSSKRVKTSSSRFDTACSRSAFVSWTRLSWRRVPTKSFS